MEKHCWILQLHLKFKSPQIKFRNSFMQDHLLSFVSEVRSYKTLFVTGQYYLKHCIFDESISLRREKFEGIILR